MCVGFEPKYNEVKFHISQIQSMVMFYFQLDNYSAINFEKALHEIALDGVEDSCKASFDKWLKDAPIEFAGTQPNTAFCAMIYFVWKAAWMASSGLDPHEKVGFGIKV